MNNSQELVELNVGGEHYCTYRSTLLFVPKSRLAKWFDLASVPNVQSTQTGTDQDQCPPKQDRKNRYVIDRDGLMFRHVLNYLRNKGSLVLPDDFADHQLLRVEATYYGLDDLVRQLSAKQPTNKSESRTLSRVLSTNSSATADFGANHASLVTGANHSVTSSTTANSATSNVSSSLHGGYGVLKGTGGPGFITVGYRGSFAFGRDGLADVKFRKLTKILVSGKVAICREVFGDTLNESRDPDHCDDDNRYTARFFLKHLCLEQSFDCLQEAGFKCVGACGSGTASIPATEPVKPGIDSEETRWNHYNEFIFCRP